MKVKFRLRIEDELLRKAQDLAAWEHQSLDDFFAQLIEKTLAEDQAAKALPEKQERRQK